MPGDLFSQLFGSATTPRKTVPKSAKEYLFKKQKGRCMYCGIKLAIHLLTSDHKAPLALGAKNNEGNFQLLCASCNGIKGGDFTDGEFRRAYKLVPSRQAKNPPARMIPRSYFDEITKARRAKRAAARKRESDNDPWGW